MPGKFQSGSRTEPRSVSSNGFASKYSRISSYIRLNVNGFRAPELTW